MSSSMRSRPRLPRRTPLRRRQLDVERWAFADIDEGYVAVTGIGMDDNGWHHLRFELCFVCDPYLSSLTEVEPDKNRVPR